MENPIKRFVTVIYIFSIVIMGCVNYELWREVGVSRVTIYIVSALTFVIFGILEAILNNKEK